MVITSTGAAQAVTIAPGNLILLPSWSNKNGATYLECMGYSDLNCGEKMVRSQENVDFQNAGLCMIYSSCTSICVFPPS